MSNWNKTGTAGSPGAGTAKSRLLYPSTAGGAATHNVQQQQDTEDWLRTQGLGTNRNQTAAGTGMAVRADVSNTRPRDPMKRDGWCASCPCCLTDDSCCAQCDCSRCVLVVLNIIFLIVGAGCLAGAIYFWKTQDVVDVCTWCKDIAIGIMSLGGLILVISLFGFCTAVSKASENRCCGTMYIVFMFILFLIGGALTAMTVMIKTSIASGVVNDKLKDGWESAVKSDPQNVCEVQDQLKCSGFDICCTQGCPGYNASAPPKGCPVCSKSVLATDTVESDNIKSDNLKAPVIEAPLLRVGNRNAQVQSDTPKPDTKKTPEPATHSPIKPATPRPETSSPSAKSTTYTVSCHQKLKDSVDDYFPGLIAGTGAFTLIALLQIILGCCTCCKGDKGYNKVPVAYSGAV